jgi:erythrocyte band 7 integral membrane protein
VKVERVEVKDVRVPESLQRAMAAEAEAAREARAKVIAAEGEHKASRALRHAADGITGNPAALQVISLTIVYILSHLFTASLSPNLGKHCSRKQQHHHLSRSY